MSAVLSTPNSSRMTASFSSNTSRTRCSTVSCTTKLIARTACSWADAVDAADPLFELHRVPGNVVVDHHVAELQVQALAAGVGRHQEAGSSRRTNAARARARPVPSIR